MKKLKKKLMAAGTVIACILAFKHIFMARRREC